MKKWFYKLKECQNYNILILAVLAALVIRLVLYVYITAMNVYQRIMLPQYGQADYEMAVTPIITVVFIILAMIFVTLAVKNDPGFMIAAITSLAVVAVAGVSFCAVQCLLVCGYWLWMVKKASGIPLFRHVKKLAAILIGVAFAAFLVWELSVWIPEGFGSLYEEAWFVMTYLLRNIFNPEVFLLIYIYRDSESRKFKAMLKVFAAVIAAAVIMNFAAGFGSLGHWSEWGPEETPGNYDSPEAGDWSEWSTEEDITYGTDEDGNVTFQMEAVEE